MSNPQLPATGDGELNTQLDDFAQVRNLKWYSDEAKCRAAIHSYVSTAVQEAVASEQMEWKREVVKLIEEQRAAIQTAIEKEREINHPIIQQVERKRMLHLLAQHGPLAHETTPRAVHERELIQRFAKSLIASEREQEPI